MNSNVVKTANAALNRQANAAANQYGTEVATAIVASPNANAFAKNVRNAKNNYVSNMTSAYAKYTQKIANARAKLGP
jgi:hypothetical protein